MSARSTHGARSGAHLPEKALVHALLATLVQLNHRTHVAMRTVLDDDEDFLLLLDNDRVVVLHDVLVLDLA